ncbi:MAG: DUF308 domain-containing protein [Paramuribaculum sp.]|nr:DUF308 domain-containing protein [Paramuribaculum sp.]
MNNKFSSWIITLVIAVVGVLLIVWHNEVDLFSWLIRALGIILAAPAIYVLLSSLSALRHNRLKATAEITDAHTGTTELKFSSSTVAWSLIIVSVATIVLGFWMLINPGFFVGLVSYLFAIVVIIFGILQIVDVAYLTRPVILPVYFYILPALLIIAGIVIMCTNVKTIDGVVTLITGILLVLYSVNRIAQQIVYYSESRKIKNQKLLNP